MTQANTPKEPSRTPKQSLIIVLALLILFGYATYDYFYVKPEVNQKIEKVRKQYIDIQIIMKIKYDNTDSTVKVLQRDYEQLKRCGMSKSEFNKMKKK